MQMPLMVRVLKEDLPDWEPAARSPQAHHYRPRLGPGVDQETAEQIQVMAPAPLEDLADQDLVWFVSIEKGWMSKKVGSRPEVKFQLKDANEPLREPRRLRLKIKSLDKTSRAAPGHARGIESTKCKIHQLELICPKCRSAKGAKKTATKHGRKMSEWGKPGGRPRNPEIARIMKQRGVSRQRAYQILAEGKKG